jgi:hypothetical protein
LAELDLVWRKIVGAVGTDGVRFTVVFGDG